MMKNLKYAIKDKITLKLKEFNEKFDNNKTTNND